MIITLINTSWIPDCCQTLSFVVYSGKMPEKEKNMQITYRPKGTCSRLMEIETDGNTVKSLKVLGGCDGNLKGIAKLVEGMEIDEVISRLEGVRCGSKSTSCPDQIAKALKMAKEQA